MKRTALLIFAPLTLFAACGALSAQNQVTPQDLVPEAPTLHCLGVRWYVSGDHNGNARVDVTYRRQGEQTWHQAMPLFRVGTDPDSQEGEKRLAAQWDRGWPFPVGNLFGGSILDLRPNTAYEVKLVLSDPDGGGATRTLQMHTKREPREGRPKRTLHVVPGSGGGTGTLADPLRGLAAAHSIARPGDLILVHAGVYPGTLTMTRSGTPDAPIVWKGAADGEAVIDAMGPAGKPLPRGVSANQVQYVFFDGLSVRNADFGFVAHGASDLTIRHCHFYRNEFGIAAHSNHDSPTGVQRNFYFADNVIEGPSTWPRTRGIEDARGIQVSGEGHDICYNRIRGFGDGADIMGRGPNRAIDFYNNEVSECTDDAFELDYGQSNVRAIRNRITNCFEGVSTQPIFGGPAYILRNAMYNLEYTQFKMHNNPSGGLYLHNTVVKTGMAWVLWTSEKLGREYSRNNLFVGTSDSHAFEHSPYWEVADYDYDGFAMAEFSQFASLQNIHRFDTFEDFRTKSGIEPHATFLGADPKFASGVKPPTDRKIQFPIAVNDLRLAKDSKAIDAGIFLPNIDDGFAGKAPDLGAYEYGEPVPHYGPR